MVCVDPPLSPLDRSLSGQGGDDPSDWVQVDKVLSPGEVKGCGINIG